MVIYVLISIHLSNWQCPSIIALAVQQVQLLNAELAYKLLSLTWRNFTVLISEAVSLSTTKCPVIGLQRQYFRTLPQTQSSNIIMSFLPSSEFKRSKGQLFILVSGNNGQTGPLSLLAVCRKVMLSLPLPLCHWISQILILKLLFYSFIITVLRTLYVPDT